MLLVEEFIGVGGKGRFEIFFFEDNVVEEGEVFGAGVILLFAGGLKGHSFEHFVLELFAAFGLLSAGFIFGVGFLLGEAFAASRPNSRIRIFTMYTFSFFQHQNAINMFQIYCYYYLYLIKI